MNITEEPPVAVLHIVDKDGDVWSRTGDGHWRYRDEVHTWRNLTTLYGPLGYSKPDPEPWTLWQVDIIHDPAGAVGNAHGQPWEARLTYPNPSYPYGPQREYLRAKSRELVQAHIEELARELKQFQDSLPERQPSQSYLLFEELSPAQAYAEVARLSALAEYERERQEE